MRTADRNDKDRVLELLTAAFAANRSVLYLVGRPSRKDRRIYRLMDYAFEECRAFGRVLLSDDGKACALVIFPDLKRLSPSALWRNVKLVTGLIGLMRLRMVLEKEKKIAAQQQQALSGRLPYYIWFIAVDPDFQGMGLGSALLDELLADAAARNRVPLLETSTLRNLPFYERAGFVRYGQLDVSYPLHFFRRE